MKYENRKNGKVAVEVKRDDEKGTVLLKYEDGKDTMITTGTLKRWWKKLADDEEETVVAQEPEEEVVVEEQETEIADTAEVVETVVKAPKKERKPRQKKEKAEGTKKERTPRVRTVDKKVDLLPALVEEFGEDTIATNDASRRTFYIKQDKHRIAAVVVSADNIKIAHDRNIMDVVTNTYKSRSIKRFGYITQVATVDALINTIKTIMKED